MPEEEGQDDRVQKMANGCQGKGIKTVVLENEGW